MLAWLSIFLKGKDYTIEISRKVVTHCRLATNWAPLDTKANGYDMNTQRTTVVFIMKWMNQRIMCTIILTICSMLEIDVGITETTTGDHIPTDPDREDWSGRGKLLE